MSTPEIKIGEQDKSAEDAIVPAATPPVEKEQASKASPSNDTVFSSRERVPSDWEINGTDEDGVIHARNNATGRVFEGSLDDFNVKLRG